MPKIAMLAKLTAAEGKRDELVTVMSELVKAVEDEPGTLAYALHTDDADANVVWFYELYENEDALKAHGGSEAMRAVGGKLAGLVGGRPELIRVTPVAGKGLPI